MIELFVAMQLITVHMIDGTEVSINPAAITMMRKGRDADDPRRQFPEDVQCVIWFGDGHFLSIAETCAELIKMMSEADAITGRP